MGSINQNALIAREFSKLSRSKRKEIVTPGFLPMSDVGLISWLILQSAAVLHGVASFFESGAAQWGSVGYSVFALTLSLSIRLSLKCGFNTYISVIVIEASLLSPLFVLSGDLVVMYGFVIYAVASAALPHGLFFRLSPADDEFYSYICSHCGYLRFADDDFYEMLARESAMSVNFLQAE